MLLRLDRARPLWESADSMPIKSLYITLLLMLGTGLSAAAQSEIIAPEAMPATTPRKDFVAFISGTPVPDLKFKPLGAPPEEPVLGFTLPEPNVPEKLPIDPDAPAPANEGEIPDAQTEETDDASLIVLEKTPEEPPKKKDTPGILPFYVTAAEYRASREVKAQHIALTYTVSAANAKSGLKVPDRTVKILIGPDYAASVQDEETRIYDFRTARLLTVRKAEDALEFDNISLYAAAYKNVDTVNRATRSGALESIKIGPALSLDSFWLEASMGWTARTDFNTLSAERSGANVTAAYDGKTILTLDLSGPELPSESHMRNLFAFWHHNTAIHPAILTEIGRPERAPKSMVLTSVSPNVPDGLITKWTLTEARTEKADFPLPEAAKSVLEKDTVSPLAFVIAAAAKGDNVPGWVSNSQLREDMHKQREARKDFEAWLTGKILADRLGGCENDPALLCEDIKDFESGAKPETDLAKLPKIIAQTEVKSTRADAFEALMPYVKDEIAPAFLVKIAGQTRARIKSSALTPKLQAVRAGSLLEEALAKNPYDPEIYQSLAQVYAAEGRFAESWDIYDAMRGLKNVPSALTAPINRAEGSIKARAPGFFAPLTP